MSAIAFSFEVACCEVHQKTRLLQPLSSIHATVDDLKNATRLQLSKERCAPHPGPERVLADKRDGKLHTLVNELPGEGVQFLPVSLSRHPDHALLVSWPWWFPMRWGNGAKLQHLPCTMDDLSLQLMGSRHPENVAPGVEANWERGEVK